MHILAGAGLLAKKWAKPWVIIGGLWAVALLARLIFYALFLRNNPCLLMFDSGHYHTMAVHLVEQGAFCDAMGVYDFYRMPGYPLFLTACYNIFGVWPQAAIGVQMVIAAYMPVQVLFLMCAIGTACNLPSSMIKRLSFIVAVVMIFDLGALIFSGLLMTDMLFTMGFIGFLHVLVKAWQKGAWQLMLTAGVLLGLCNLVRPLIFLPVCIFALIFFLFSGIWKQRVLLSLSFLTGWGAVVCCWLVRNWLLTGLWFLHTLSGPHLLNHGAARVYAMANHATYEIAREAVCEQVSVQASPILASEEQELVARRVLLTYWPQTIQLAAVNCIKTLAALYSSELLVIDAEGELPPYEGSCNLIQRAKRFMYPAVHNVLIRYVCWLEIIMQLLLMIGLCGFMFCCRRFLLNQRLLLLLVGVCVCVIATTAICGFARLRLPIESILIMVAVLFYLCGARTKGNGI